MHPRNAREMADADGVGRAGEADCESITVWIRIRDDTIREITAICRGCPPAVAAASIVTELACGLHVDAAAEITQDTVVTALGGLPAEKRHVAGLAAEALADAIWDYVGREIDSRSRQE
jgi:nitrogen fixation NifU-like protein